MASSSGGAATVLLARLVLLALNMTLFGLGVTLLVMGTRRSHYSGLMSSIYQQGGLTVAIFEEPDAALMITGMFLTIVSLKVRAGGRGRERRYHHLPVKAWESGAPLIQNQTKHPRRTDEISCTRTGKTNKQNSYCIRARRTVSSLYATSI